ncbi:N-acetylmuramidase domain-containing protein [Xanthomonas oryzae pv. oryzicola]|uniref:N-acetylmuramidase domain-containing protein n=1 Tax=Xanthomonas oryzae TaxID=347 RepID=UPI003D16B16E
MQDAAKELRCEPGLIFAIATQESSQSSFIDLDGNKIPAILYERHWFRKLTNPSKNQPSPYEATHPNICGPAYKRAKKNKKGEYVEKKTGNIVQEDDIYGSPGIHQYKRLLIAYKLNQEAALQSCSWGKFQIMGFNYKVAGFASVKEFTKAMSLSDAEHMKAFLKFAKSNPTLLEGLQNKESPLKNPQTTSIARLHLRFRCAGIASFRYATSWFLAVFAHAYTPSCRRAVACR